MYTKGNPVQIPNPAHWNLIASARPHHRLRYRPTVFSRHLRLTALSFLQGKTGRAFQVRYSSFSRRVRKIAQRDHSLRYVCLTVCMEQLRSHWTNFHEI
jgi:hypothetical protein